MNLEQARYNMVEQQLRPWEVLDQTVLDLLYVVRREEFVPPAYRQLAFTDTEIPLGHNATMLPPKVEARALQALKVRKSDRVLEIGTGSGYMAALLAAHATQVWTVEIVPELAESAVVRLKQQGIHNVGVCVGDASEGWPAQAPYDLIMVSGALTDFPQSLLDQLKIGGRLLGFVGEAPLMETRLVTRRSEREFDTQVLFETLVPSLERAHPPSRFSF